MFVEMKKNRLLKKAAVIGLGFGFAVMAGGCRLYDPHYKRADFHTGSIYKFAHTNHPISVDRGNLAMAISVGPKDVKLMPEKRDELIMFLSYYRNQGTGYLRVQMQRHARHNQAIENVILALQQELEAMSIGPESVRVHKYVSRDAYPVIRLSFERYVARGPECNGFNQNFAQDENNGNSDYWGCATQNNLAAMVANPRDLKGPRGWSPRDARRRDKVFEKHIKGEPTGAQRSKDERVDVSGIKE